MSVLALESLSDQLVGRNVLDACVPTPLVYLDRPTLERNIARMAASAGDAGVKLRPHTKTHKLAEVADMQLKAGAVGLTVAKSAEAAALRSAGIETSVMVAQPFAGTHRLDWFADAESQAETIVCVDDLSHARKLGQHAIGRGYKVPVVLVIDTGYGRFGAAPDDAVAMAAEISAARGLQFHGIRSYPGRVYAATDPETRTSIALEDAAVMRDVGSELLRHGLPCDVVSVGSTPSLCGLTEPLNVPGITEWRPGNYVFFDAMQLSLGCCDVEDCALQIIASVVSSAARGAAIIDAGMKTLSATPDPGSTGHGVVLHDPRIEVVHLSEESGWLGGKGAASLGVGERLRIVPNHACEMTNLASVVAVGSQGTIEDLWSPASAGMPW